MEIITIGNLSKKLPSVHVTCEECGTILEVNRLDFHNLPYKYVPCPICGEAVILTEDEYKRIKR